MRFAASAVLAMLLPLGATAQVPMPTPSELQLNRVNVAAFMKAVNGKQFEALAGVVSPGAIGQSANGTRFKGVNEIIGWLEREPCNFQFRTDAGHFSDDSISYGVSAGGHTIHYEHRLAYCSGKFDGFHLVRFVTSDRGSIEKIEVIR